MQVKFVGIFPLFAAIDFFSQSLKRIEGSLGEEKTGVTVLHTHTQRERQQEPLRRVAHLLATAALSNLNDQAAH